MGFDGEINLCLPPSFDDEVMEGLCYCGVL